MDGTGDSNSDRSDEEGLVAQSLEFVHSTPSSKATSLPSASRASMEGSVEDGVWITSDNSDDSYIFTVVLRSSGQVLCCTGTGVQ